jgi:hypothetical protein
MLSKLFSGPQRRTDRVLAATRQRNRPVRGWVQGSLPRPAERGEVDPPLRRITLKTYQGESWMLDSPESVCAGQHGSNIQLLPYPLVT